MNAPATLAAREELLRHPLYGYVDDIGRLRAFMRDHVFAVWDFMSLLKRLQRDFTCVALPWIPPRDAFVARFINEIVLSEESDCDPRGNAASHLDIYLSAMDEVGADRTPFLRFVERLVAGDAPARALDVAAAPRHVRDFVLRTLAVATNGHTVEVLADFLYSREDVIPEMFGRLLTLWGNPQAEVPAFTFYLERHVELDAGDHGPKARRMLERLVANDDALHVMAEHAACAGIRSRINLWDGIAASLAEPLIVPSTFGSLGAFQWCREWPALVRDRSREAG
jgi:hypothetical protein